MLDYYLNDPIFKEISKYSFYEIEFTTQLQNKISLCFISGWRDLNDGIPERS